MGKEKEFALPKKWDPEQNTFQGKSGKTYKILDSLPLGRYQLLPTLELKLAFGCDSNAIIQFCNLFWSHFDGKVEMSIVAQHAVNLSRAYKDLDQRKGAIIRFCALWTTSEGEDISDLTEELIEEKAKDWANIDTTFFFQIVTKRVPTYLKNWRQISQMISHLETTNKIELVT